LRDKVTPEWEPCRFIDEEIDVHFDRPPLLTKKPNAPDGFKWQGVPYRVSEVLSSWHDYRRRGRMAKNMKPARLRAATRKGSWGVGRLYFRVRTGEGRVFDLYYDRAPKQVADRVGPWYLWREMEAR
jgi:hypothetical protein